MKLLLKPFNEAILGVDYVSLCKLNLLYGLGRRNLQWPGVLDLTSEPKMFHLKIFVGFESEMHNSV